MDVGTLAVTTLLAGFKGSWIVGYANRLIAADPTPGNEGVLKMTTGGGIDSRELDSPITNMALHGGRVAISTRSGIWLLGGRSDAATGKWLGEPDPLFSHGSFSDSEDYIFLESYGGKLYTWLGGQVMEWNPNAGASKQGWRAAGLEGRACYGGAIAGNMLVVSIQNRAAEYELWAFDGTGWWLMRSVTTAARVWPAYLSGAGNMDLIAFRNGDAGVACDLYRMVYRDAGAHAYATTGSFVTSLLDAGDRDADKSWRAIGATFAAPAIRGNPASVDGVTVTLSWSIDAGETWTVAASANVSDPTQRTLTLRADLPSNAAVSRFLQLKVTWLSVADWAPVLTGLWAEHATLDAPARRRRWTFGVMARDGLVRRDGSVSSKTGRQQIADLWSAWSANQTIALKDIDYDSDPVTRQVRVVDIEETVTRSSDASRWGEASVRLGLVEV
jgi:FlaG/FlaF family flagellin (archaellin)